MEFKKRSLMQIADMICGNSKGEETFFRYRSSSHLTEFFQDCDTDYEHDGSTRNYWVAEALHKILAEPHQSPNMPPETFLRVIRTLMEPEDAMNEAGARTGALEVLNAVLRREGYEAFYAPDLKCYLRHVATNFVSATFSSPHRPFSASEIKKRERLTDYLNGASEDNLIEEILLPLFRQLGFHRITAAAHKDKALEYGKDVWMKFTLPTQHVLYFGIQVKKGKLDASGVSKNGNANVAEIHNQATMDLLHV